MQSTFNTKHAIKQNFCSQLGMLLSLNSVLVLPWYFLYSFCSLEKKMLNSNRNDVVFACLISCALRSRIGQRSKSL